MFTEQADHNRRLQLGRRDIKKTQVDDRKIKKVRTNINVAVRDLSFINFSILNLVFGLIQFPHRFGVWSNLTTRIFPVIAPPPHEL